MLIWPIFVIVFVLIFVLGFVLGFVPGCRAIMAYVCICVRMVLMWRLPRFRNYIFSNSIPRQAGHQ